VPDLEQAIVFFSEVVGADYLSAFEEGPGTGNPADLKKMFGVAAEVS
jgi:hypothetical protein